MNKDQFDYIDMYEEILARNVQLVEEIKILKSQNEFLSRKISHPCFGEGFEKAREQAALIADEVYDPEIGNEITEYAERIRAMVYSKPEV